MTLMTLVINRVYPMDACLIDYGDCLITTRTEHTVHRHKENKELRKGGGRKGEYGPN